MKKYDLLIDGRKIIVFATIEGINDIRRFKFLLDTGASKTVIDDGIVNMLGYELNMLEKGSRMVTASGTIYSKILKLPKFSLFGKDWIDFDVNVIKFPLQITYHVDGVLGMDFLLQFKNIKFNFDEKTIEV